ncbi:hypothetical protein IMCC12053_165 [Celeribacter marinus]|uniref:Uncharacterized protein n=1 Tax=Celeribacter marinus TaxID=1397108 RepID=A0A0N9ZEX0_9RHOB|nr:hypothetical protein IMCC12053_165 [Celeribacter marinus]
MVEKVADLKRREARAPTGYDRKIRVPKAGSRRPERFDQNGNIVCHGLSNGIVGKAKTRRFRLARLTCNRPMLSVGYSRQAA